MTIELTGLEILADGFAFTECPRWRDGWLYFSDMYGATVYRVSEAGAVEDVVREEARPGGLGFLSDGSLLVSAMDAGRVMRLKDGAYTLYCDLSVLAPGGINDMVVSAEGRCYIAPFTHEKKDPPQRPLLLIDENGVASHAADPLKVANGMILTADRKRIIVGESAGGRVSVLDLGEGGRPENRRTFAELPAGHYADGICGDDTGGVWVACCRGPGVVRVEDNGEITHRITIGDGRYAYACALGGADGRTLFICTAGSYEPDRMAVKRSARIETVRAPFAGSGTP
jgi:sugar lactone lactonase YvrE